MGSLQKQNEKLTGLGDVLDPHRVAPAVLSNLYRRRRQGLDGVSEVGQLRMRAPDLVAELVHLNVELLGNRGACARDEPPVSWSISFRRPTF